MTYAANIVLSTDKDGIVREVEAMKSASEEALAKVEQHKATLTKCSELLENLIQHSQKNERKTNG